MSVWKRKGENVISGKKLDSDQEETQAVSATERIIVDNKHNRPFLLKRRRNRVTEEPLREALAPGEKVLLEGKVCGKLPQRKELHESVV